MFVYRNSTTGDMVISLNCRQDDVFGTAAMSVGAAQNELEIYQLSDAVCSEMVTSTKATKPVYNAGVVTVEVYETVVEDPQNAGQPLFQNLEATHPTQPISYASLYDGEGNFIVPDEFIPA